ncbi:MAG: thiamine-phosphate kinase, partial [Mycobacteriales bacterium]
ATASAVAIDLDRAALDLPEQLRDVGAALGKDPYDWVLSGGEDHALVATFPAGVPDGWRTIGRVLAGDEVRINGEPVMGGGHDHFG